MKITAEQRAAIHELVDLSLDTPKEKAHVFVDIAPHCSSLCVRVHAFGWHQGSDAVYNNHADYWSTAVRTLEEVRNTLAGIDTSPEAKRQKILADAQKLRDAADQLEATAI